MLSKTRQRLKLIDFVREDSRLKKISCGAVCGFQILPRVKRNLLKVRKQVTFIDLCNHILGYAYNQVLSDAIHTGKETESVIEACDMFREECLACRRPGRPQSKNIAWIIPNSHLGLEGEEIVANIINDLCFRLPSYKDWLAWMSLEIANLIHGWQPDRLRGLRRAVFKLTTEFDGRTDSVYPWEPNFNRDVAALPIQTLYQFEPTRSTENSLKAIVNVGFHSIDHLRFLHPEGSNCAKHSKKLLFTLYGKLESINV